MLKKLADFLKKLQMLVVFADKIFSGDRRNFPTVSSFHWHYYRYKSRFFSWLKRSIWSNRLIVGNFLLLIVLVGLVLHLAAAGFFGFAFEQFRAMLSSILSQDISVHKPAVWLIVLIFGGMAVGVIGLSSLAIWILNRAGKDKVVSGTETEEEKKRRQNEKGNPIVNFFKSMNSLLEVTTGKIKSSGKDSGKDGGKKGHLALYLVIVIGLWDGIGLYLMKSDSALYLPWKDNPWLFWVLLPVIGSIAAWVFTQMKLLPSALAATFMLILLNDARIAYAQTTWWKDTQASLQKWENSQHRKNAHYPHLRPPEERMAQPGDPDCDLQWVTPPVFLGSNEYCRYETEDRAFIRLNGRKWFPYHPAEVPPPYTDKVEKVEFMSATGKPIRVTVTFITKQEAMGN